jgi:hypothetical protein
MTIFHGSGLVISLLVYYPQKQDYFRWKGSLHFSYCSLSPACHGQRAIKARDYIIHQNKHEQIHSTQSDHA